MKNLYALIFLILFMIAAAVVMNFFLIKKKKSTVESKQNTIIYDAPDSMLIYPDSLLLIIGKDSIVEKVSFDQYNKYRAGGMRELKHR